MDEKDFASNSSEEELEDSFLDLGTNLDDVPDQVVLPDGTETELRIVKMARKVSQNSGNAYIGVTFDAFNEPLAKLINHTLMLPKDDDEEKTKVNKLRRIRDFYTAFGIPSSGRVDFEMYVGNTGWAILGVQSDVQYGDKNVVRRFTGR